MLGVSSGPHFLQDSTMVRSGPRFLKEGCSSGDKEGQPVSSGPALIRAKIETVFGAFFGEKKLKEKGKMYRSYIDQQKDVKEIFYFQIIYFFAIFCDSSSNSLLSVFIY